MRQEGRTSELGVDFIVNNNLPVGLIIVTNTLT